MAAASGSLKSLSIITLPPKNVTSVEHSGSGAAGKTVGRAAAVHRRRLDSEVRPRGCRRPGWLCPHSPLRVPRQPRAPDEARPLPRAPRPATPRARLRARVRRRAHAAADRHRHRALPVLPSGPAAPHRDPRAGSACAARACRGHLLILSSPVPTRLPDPTPRSCARRRSQSGPRPRSSLARRPHTGPSGQTFLTTFRCWPPASP